MSRLSGTISTISLSTALLSAAANAASDHRDHVLGTSFDMTLHGITQAKSQEIFDATVAEIGRLENHFSPKKSDSELSFLNRSLEAISLSSDMAALLQACEIWRVKTANALSCRIGTLETAWHTASKTGVLPDREYMKQLAQSALEAAFNYDNSTGILLRDSQLSLNPTGLAKGYILDKAIEKARSLAPTATGIKIDIGGDAVYWGTTNAGKAWTVGVADPLDPKDNGAFLSALALKSKAIASSGHRNRTIKVADKNYSQIINPRTGWVMEDSPSATVVADNAIAADALATALSTMPIKEGLKLVNSLAGVEALIIAPDKRLFPSSGWHTLKAEFNAGPTTVWENDFTFNVDFTIPKPTEGNYKRPYLAVWITTPEKKLVKSLLLLGESRRWMEENYVFWRRYGRKFDSIVDGVTRPTRMPGDYHIAWDGRDDFGEGVLEGDYILHVEVSREHGDHTYKRFPISLGANSFNINHAGESEIGEFNIRFGAATNTQRHG